MFRPLVQQHVLAAALCFAPLIAEARDFTFHASLKAASYPDVRGLTYAGVASSYQRDLQGVVGFAVDTPITSSTLVAAELTAYRSAQGASHLDGIAALRYENTWSVEAGLVRQRWGRTERSELDILGPPITVFSLLDQEETVSQPTVHVWTNRGAVRLDVSALVGRRAQPIPERDARFGFGVPVEEHTCEGSLGRSAVAVRVSGANARIDWAAHAYHGLARRPAYVTQLTESGVGVQLAYDEISQLGGEIETNLGMWRLWAEGFYRHGARQRDGVQTDFTHTAVAAEHQWFGALGERFDLFTELRIAFDSRGLDADRPLQNTASLSWTALGTGRRPYEAELSVIYDWKLEGAGVKLTLSKELAAEPRIKAGFEVVAFEGGSTPSLLDVFERDTEVALRLEWEL